MTLERARHRQSLSIALSYVASDALTPDAWRILQYFRAFLVDDDEVPVEMLRVSIDTLAGRLGMARHRVVAALALLVARRMVLCETAGGKGTAATWSFNELFAEWRVRWAVDERTVLAELGQLSFSTPANWLSARRLPRPSRSGKRQLGTGGAEIHAWMLPLRGRHLFPARHEKKISPAPDGDSYAGDPDNSKRSSAPRPPRSPLSVSSRERGGELAHETPQGLRLLGAITEATDEVLFDSKKRAWRSEILAAACDTQDVDYVVDELYKLRRRRQRPLGWRGAHQLVLLLLDAGPPPERGSGPSAWEDNAQESYLHDQLNMALAELELRRAQDYPEEALADEVAFVESLRERLAACHPETSTKEVR